MPGAPGVLAAALLLDAWWGEPGWLYRRVPHPVVLCGRLIAAGTRWGNRPRWSASARRLAGIVLIAGLVAGAGALGWFLETALGVSPWLWPLEAAAVAGLLAGRSLHDHVAAVADALRGEGVAAGRRAVARIVGRDVRCLDRAGVARAAVETLAENAADGVVAPALAYLAGGLPGLLIYKAVNTADSMIGHRDPRYRAFGWAAARLDDLLNLVPARVTAGLLALAARGGSARRRALVAAWRMARRHRSPNAGWPEAAMAGALGVALGGPRHYGPLAVPGAWLGAGRDALDAADIDRALALYRRALGLGGLILLVLAGV